MRDTVALLTARPGGQQSYDAAGVSSAERLRAELAPMSVRDLKRRALEGGVDAETVDSVDESEDPKKEVIRLLVEAAEGSAASTKAALESLRAELAPLKLRALKQRAVAHGAIAAEKVDEVDDTDDPKASIIDLLVDAQPGGLDKKTFKEIGKSVVLLQRFTLMHAAAQDDALARLLRILFNAWFGIVMAVIMLKYIYFGKKTHDLP